MKKLLPTFFFLILIRFACAQDAKLVTISVENASFSQVVEKLEKQTDYRVFYKSEWVDSLTWSFSVSNKPIEDVLDVLVQNTSLNYYISNQQVFITNGVKILTNPKIAELIKGKSYEERNNVEKGLIFTREYQTENKDSDDPSDKLFEIGEKDKLRTGSYSTVAGYVKDVYSGEPVPGVLVYSKEPLISSTTDESGFYSISLPVGKNRLIYQLVGMKPTQRNLVVFSDGQLNVAMEEDIRALREVVIESDRRANVENVQMGISKIDITETKNVPIVLGERDVMKVATTLAGIKTVGEGAAGFNVRGGKADQNLITLDGAPIYNTSHFLGFFSVFNSEAIEDMQIYKGSIPARYGGRLSSVMDISSRPANYDSISGSGGISPVTSKLTVELPVVKGKAGIMFGGRTTYSNWLLKRINDANFSENRVSFSDVIFRGDYEIDPDNKLKISAYYSVDDFRMNSDTLFSLTDFQYENLAGSFNYLHHFSDKLSASVSALYSSYQYDLSYDSSPPNAFSQDFNITEKIGKGEVNYAINDFHEFLGGLEVKRIDVSPGAKYPLGEESLVQKQEIEEEQGVEAAAFISDRYKLSNSISLYAGLRYSLFAALGPQTVYEYLSDSPKNNKTRVDSVQYAKGDFIKTYHGLEPRVSARVKINEQSSVKGGYNRTRQYIHTLTNSASISPSDIWRISNTHLKPQVADQFSLGYYHNFNHNSLETSVEVYYKKIQNLLDFKVGSQFLLNPVVETAALQGPGKSYGLEFSLKKSGKLSGWLNYTYSRTFIKLDSEHAEERINEGAYYPANYDIPHAVNLVANYKLTHRISFSYNFVYKSGRPITYPEGVYDFHGSLSVHYSDRNAYRIPHYMRMDIGVNLEAGHKLGKLAYGYWSFSIYNVLGRSNPYSVFFSVDRDEIKGHKLVVFGSPIPTITYNFKF